MEIDTEYRHFVFKYDLENSKNTNGGDLQNLYDDGWMLEWQSDEIVHKNVVHIFMTLARSTLRSEK